MRVIDEGEKNVIYRNLLESINDILPRIPLITVMLCVWWKSEEVKWDVMRCWKWSLKWSHTNTFMHLKAQIIYI